MLGWPGQHGCPILLQAAKQECVLSGDAPASKLRLSWRYRLDTMDVQSPRTISRPCVWPSLATVSHTSTRTARSHTCVHTWMTAWNRHSPNTSFLHESGLVLAARYWSVKRLYCRIRLDFRPLGGSRVILTPFCEKGTRGEDRGTQPQSHAQI